ncbi:hypothetical protein GGX14DRAFT_645478 [Mycena pura]|uniref:Uncharacterized protein n=1 Tax=Mycena pura TaxID=153505 RepID=A0AAD6YA38_9AGAR|nr:hypothetical protein GGX14DRAFT_645478 [Mycena pura]
MHGIRGSLHTLEVKMVVKHASRWRSADFVLPPNLRDVFTKRMNLPLLETLPLDVEQPSVAKRECFRCRPAPQNVQSFCPPTSLFSIPFEQLHGMDILSVNSTVSFCLEDDLHSRSTCNLSLSDVHEAIDNLLYALKPPSFVWHLQNLVLHARRAFSDAASLDFVASRVAHAPEGAVTCGLEIMLIFLGRKFRPVVGSDERFGPGSLPRTTEVQVHAKRLKYS